MSDLISRDALIERVCADCELREAGICKERGEVMGCLADEINSSPAVDAVEVVRCRDCMQYTKRDNYRGKEFGFSWCHKFGNITKPDDFCSYGERIERRMKNDRSL